MMVATLGIALPEIKQSFSLSAVAAGSLFSVMMMVAALTSAGAGRLADRIGAKKVLIAGLTLLGLGFAGAGMSEHQIVFACFLALTGVGYGFTPPIPDLVIDDEGIRATLSFNRVPFSTFIPWSAIYLIADFDGNGAVWQEDIPSDLKMEQDAGGAPPSATPKEPEPPEPKKPRPSHLKLVK